MRLCHSQTLCMGQVKFALIEFIAFNYFTLKWLLNLLGLLLFSFIPGWMQIFTFICWVVFIRDHPLLLFRVQSVSVVVVIVVVVVVVVVVELWHPLLLCRFWPVSGLQETGVHPEAVHQPELWQGDGAHAGRLHPQAHLETRGPGHRRNLCSRSPHQPHKHTQTQTHTHTYKHTHTYRH